jgi:hypothetical protein
MSHTTLKLLPNHINHNNVTCARPLLLIMNEHLISLDLSLLRKHNYSDENVDHASYCILDTPLSITKTNCHNSFFVQI